MSARNIEACLCFFTLSPSSDSFMLKSTAWSNKSDSEQLPEHFVQVWLSRKKKETVRRLRLLYVSFFSFFLHSERAKNGSFRKLCRLRTEMHEM
jgi:hypothetical protein